MKESKIPYFLEAKAAGVIVDHQGLIKPVSSKQFWNTRGVLLRIKVILLSEIFPFQTRAKTA